MNGKGVLGSVIRQSAGKYKGMIFQKEAVLRGKLTVPGGRVWLWMMLGRPSESP